MKLIFGLDTTLEVYYMFICAELPERIISCWNLTNCVSYGAMMQSRLARVD